MFLYEAPNYLGETVRNGRRRSTSSDAARARCRPNHVHISILLSVSSIDHVPNIRDPWGLLRHGDYTRQPPSWPGDPQFSAHLKLKHVATLNPFTYNGTYLYHMLKHSKILIGYRVFMILYASRNTQWKFVPTESPMDTGGSSPGAEEVGA